MIQPESTGHEYLRILKALDVQASLNDIEIKRWIANPEVPRSNLTRSNILLRKLTMSILSIVEKETV